ncbi:MAG: metal ABC transporter permease [Verrucomicrobiota bacterium]|nr:metal ABC transporter permease [Verrucomicrobiota bacterium]
MFEALTNPNVPFLRYALIAGVLASVSFGITGTYVVTRRISFIAGAISHSVLGGVGFSLFMSSKYGWTWFSPMAGATLAALSAALIIGFVSLYASEREDTVIGTVWAVGMSLGLLFISATPGYVDPMSYLFGNILLITKEDLSFIAVLDVVTLGNVVLFYNKFLAVCFDEEFVRLRNIKARFYYIFLLCLIALTVVLLIRIVGIVMVIALLTIPPAVANNFTRKISTMMIFSVILCMFFTVSGIAVSYTFELPAGPSIILISGITFLFVATMRFFKTR